MRPIERGTLEAVVQARNAAAQCGGPGAAGRRGGAADRRARQALCLVGGLSGPEGEPNFQQLQSDLSDIENKLAAARRFFNNAVSEYNAALQVISPPSFSRRAWALPSANSSTSGRPAVSSSTRRPA